VTKNCQSHFHFNSVTARRPHFTVHYFKPRSHVVSADFTVKPGQSDESCSTFLYSQKEMAEVHKPQSETTITGSVSGGNWPLFSFFWYFSHHFNVLTHLISFLLLLALQRFLSKSTRGSVNENRNNVCWWLTVTCFRIFGHSRQFLYIHLIILILHIVNIICFIITVTCLVSHWTSMSRIHR
jgi:hypothetical protein